MSGEKQGQRDTIAKMARQIIDHSRGKISAAEARKTAREAAIRADRRDKNR